MSKFNVEFFDLKNQWHDSMIVHAETAEKAKDIARKELGRGFVRFRAFAYFGSLA